MLDLQPEFLAVVEDLLHRNVPGTLVWAFGSRVTGRAQPTSDLDLVVVGDEKLPLRQLRTLQEDFQESRLPVRVDVIDWQRISPSFRAVIRQAYVVVQPATAGRPGGPDNG